MMLALKWMRSVSQLLSWFVVAGVATPRRPNVTNGLLFENLGCFRCNAALHMAHFANTYGRSAVVSGPRGCAARLCRFVLTKSYFFSRLKLTCNGTMFLRSLLLFSFYHKISFFETPFFVVGLSVYFYPICPRVTRIALS